MVGDDSFDLSPAPLVRFEEVTQDDRALDLLMSEWRGEWMRSGSMSSPNALLPKLALYSRSTCRLGTLAIPAQPSKINGVILRATSSVLLTAATRI